MKETDNIYVKLKHIISQEHSITQADIISNYSGSKTQIKHTVARWTVQ